MTLRSAVLDHHPLEIRHGGLSTIGDYRRAKVVENLFSAAEAGHVDIAEHALSMGVTPFARVQALIKAAAAGRGAVVELLLREGMEIDDELRLALEGAFGDDLSGIRQMSVRRMLAQTVEAALALRQALRQALVSGDLALSVRSESDLSLVGGRERAAEIAAQAGNERAVAFIEQLVAKKPAQVLAG